MQVAAFVISVLALVAAVSSLAWNVASWSMAGGRVTVELRLGAIGPGGMVTGKPSDLSPAWFELLVEQGYNRPIVALHVSSRGRLPVYVREWGIKAGSLTLRPIDSSIGPELPYKLEAGADETWACALHEVQSLAKIAKETLGGSAQLRGYVRLGDGRVVKSRNSAK